MITRGGNCAVITRAGAESWSRVLLGKECQWPKEVAMIRFGKFITYADLGREKKEKQRRQLQEKLRYYGPVRYAAYLWVFFCPGISGFLRQYYLYLWTLKNNWALDFRRDWQCDFERDDIISVGSAMRMFPCGLLAIPQNFELWKEEFAKRYRRPGRFKKQGLIPGWLELTREGGHPTRFTPLTIMV